LRLTAVPANEIRRPTVLMEGQRPGIADHFR
jgi:hypothetical protein